MKQKPIAILCNGPSLDDHDLGRISCETIGLNASWLATKSSYHVMSDEEQWQYFERTTGKKAEALSNLHTGKNGPAGAIKLDLLQSELPKFSWRPFEAGVYFCSTVTWVALQLAVYWKRSPIYMVGLDLQGKDTEHGIQGKMEGALGEWRLRAEARQRELMGYASALLGANGIEVVNVISDDRDSSACWAFPKKQFSRVFDSIGR